MGPNPDSDGAMQQNNHSENNDAIIDSEKAGQSPDAAPASPETGAKDEQKRTITGVKVSCFFIRNHRDRY